MPLKLRVCLANKSAARCPRPLWACGCASRPVSRSRISISRMCRAWFRMVRHYISANALYIRVGIKPSSSSCMTSLFREVRWVSSVYPNSVGCLLLPWLNLCTRTSCGSTLHALPLEGSNGWSAVACASVCCGVCGCAWAVCHVLSCVLVCLEMEVCSLFTCVCEEVALDSG